MNIQEESTENYSPNSDPIHSSFFGGEEEVQESDAESEAFLGQMNEQLSEANLEGEAVSLADEVPESKERRDEHRSHFERFLKQVQDEENLDEKLRLAVDFMEVSLSQGGTPHFRNFWEARRLCLPLFKENISASLRGQLWAKYSELSKEARRLKDLLDEQSAFAVEQIEMAIKALEQDIENFEEQVLISTLSEQIVFPEVLKEKQASYESIQKQLNVLNLQASRINGLRKELLKTEMRVRQKNKFFQRLSLAGDKIFPCRKDLIKQISQQFVEDVSQFVQVHFNEELIHDPSLYVLREEIKALQGLAKVLTLNTNAFTQTRIRLSECWDLIKVKEKERKKERAQQKTVFKQNAENIHAQIADFKEKFESGAFSVVEAQKNLDDISYHMRQVDLGRDEIKELREQLSEARRPIQEKIRAEDQARLEEENEREFKKKEKYRGLKESVESLINRQESLDADALTKERDFLLTEIQDAAITKIEKQELERLLKPLRDSISEKKEKALLDLSDDDRQAFEQLKDVLGQRKIRRDEVKAQLEILRKSAGSSSLDFEKAMNLNVQINEEKERLEKMVLGVKEIETKIMQLQNKTRAV
jgi:hypothetical protein